MRRILISIATNFRTPGGEVFCQKVPSTGRQRPISGQESRRIQMDRFGDRGNRRLHGDAGCKYSEHLLQDHLYFQAHLSGMVEWVIIAYLIVVAGGSAHPWQAVGYDRTRGNVGKGSCPRPARLPIHFRITGAQLARSGCCLDGTFFPEQAHTTGVVF